MRRCHSLGHSSKGLSGSLQRVAPAVDDDPYASDYDDLTTAIPCEDVGAFCRVIVSFLISFDAERFNREIVASIGRRK